MTAENIHAACINQMDSSRIWIEPPLFETIKPMVSKTESPESTQSVADRLRLTREAFGMKKAAWCRFVGISPAAWNNVEGSKHLPASNRISLDHALLVCRATGVGLDWIYRGQRDNVPVKVALELQRIESAAEAEAKSKRKKAS
jgi:transcriptional regulator with XRE-family HTH domain